MTICPIHLKSQENKTSCNKIVPNIAWCPVCSEPMCPICSNHSVGQISRITGYTSAVSGWNEGKKQELRDRKRYNIGGR